MLAGLCITLLASSAWALYPPGPQIAKDGMGVVLQDYVSLPLSSRTLSTYPPPINFAGQLARVNFLRSEPANAPQSSARFFVNDNNRNLYILDRTTKAFTPYVNFEEVFPKFDNDPGYAGGLMTFAFAPDYATSGRLYTVHMENPSKSGSAVPTNANLPGLDLSGGYATTPAVDPPAGTVGRQAVLVEWTDTNRSNSTFEGTAREILRVGFTTQIHPMGDLLFNPLAQPGDADYGNLYIAVGDGGAGETAGATRSIPQRLDALPGKILRITPDLNLRSADQLGPNGRYRIPTTGPDANPFVSLSLTGLKKEIYAYGFRNPHRLSWDPVSNKLIVDDIGLGSWEEVNILAKGANYGYSEREGDEQLFVGGTNDGKTGSQTSPPTPFPNPDSLTVTGIAAPVTPVYPVAEYSHRDGDAVTSGFVYRGTLMPQLDGKYIFGDITTGRLFYADLNDMIASDDGNRSTMAAVHELQVVYDNPSDTPDQGPVNRRLFDVIADAYHGRGGTSSALPGGANATSGNDPDGVPYGGGRADIRLALGGDGELYVLSKSDGLIRKLVGTVAGTVPRVTVAATDPTATEAGLTTGTVTVSRTGSTGASLTVNYTVGGSATPGSDYAALAGSVTIPAGASSAAITVTPIDDTVVEPDETVTITPAAGAGYIVGAPGGTTVTIVSDETSQIAAVALYPFSEGLGGSTADATGNGNTAAITAATWTAGKYGQALHFNGSTSFLTIPDTGALDLGSTGTVEAWVRPDAINVWHGIIAKGSANAEPAHNYALELTSTNRVECSIGNGTAANVLDSTTTVTAGTWYHLACVWTGTQLQLYVNGALNTSRSETITPLGNAAPLSIGQYGGNADRANGLIDEVRVFNIARTLVEVQGDMNTPIGSAGPDTTNPTAALTAPANGSNVSGTVTVKANASDNVGVTRVQFKLDGANLGAEDTAAPYTADWSTGGSPNGSSHVLSAIAYDAAGNAGVAPNVNVTVDNEAPTVPANVQATPFSSSRIDVSWTASTDNIGVAGYRVLRDGGVVATTTATSYQDTGLAPQTTYTYSVVAFDAANNASPASSNVSATTQSAPPPSGLAAAYRFGEGLGTSTADASANANGGTLVNGAAWTGAGKYGSAISFDGLDDHVRVADSASLDLGGTGTIEAWVKLNALNRWHSVVAKGNSNSDPAHNYALEVTNANRWVCILGNGTSRFALQSSAVPVAGQFYHVACTWDGSTVRLYVNGMLNASSSQSLSPAGNTSPLYIGQFGGNADRLNGVIDEVRIYGRALTAGEVASDMNTPL